MIADETHVSINSMVFFSPGFNDTVIFLLSSLFSRCHRHTYFPWLSWLFSERIDFGCVLWEMTLCRRREGRVSNTQMQLQTNDTRTLESNDQQGHRNVTSKERERERDLKRMTSIQVNVFLSHTRFVRHGNCISDQGLFFFSLLFLFLGQRARWTPTTSSCPFKEKHSVETSSHNCYRSQVVSSFVLFSVLFSFPRKMTIVSILFWIVLLFSWVFVKHYSHAYYVCDLSQIVGCKACRKWRKVSGLVNTFDIWQESMEKLFSATRGCDFTTFCDLYFYSERSFSVKHCVSQTCNTFTDIYATAI